MSYILDALKKSEQQRAGNQPAAAVVHVPLSPTPTRSALLPVGWGLMTLVGLLLLGGWWLASPGVPVNPMAEQPLTRPAVPEPVTMAPAPVMTTTRLPETLVPVSVTPAAETAAPAASVMAEPQPAEPQAEPGVARVQTRRLPPLESLRRIPALMINSHIYSPLADKRSVTINNRAWREGEPLAEGIVLQEITPQGIVLDVDGWPLPVNRQQGWQPVPQ